VPVAQDPSDHLASRSLSTVKVGGAGLPVSDNHIDKMAKDNNEAGKGSLVHEAGTNGRGTDTDFIKAAQRAMVAAEEAHQAAKSDPKTPQNVLSLTAKVLEESQVTLTTALAMPRRQRQSFTEFTTMLGEEAKEVAQELQNEVERYAERTLRKARSLVEDHFQIDEAFRMLGPLKEDANLARDVHDWFNLIALLPVIYFNCRNWHCSTLAPVLNMCGLPAGDFSFLHRSLPELWHGEFFETFWWVTFAYFLSDSCWMILLPTCVKSPRVIIQHHLLTIGYIMLPKRLPQYAWMMGANMIVEVNTWFLIARRAFNKRGHRPFAGDTPLLKAIRISLVSTCFYITWFGIRLALYPYMFVILIFEWRRYSSIVGSPVNLLTITPIMQGLFIYLNIKWSIDLIRSKLKGRGPSKGL